MVGAELKFHVPAEHAAAVHRELATATARVCRLRTWYFDTPDRRLAAGGFLLRLRRADGHWVQTLAGRVDGGLPHHEHDVPIVGQRLAAQLDIKRHEGTPIGKALAASLGNDDQLLQAVFETDIRRTSRVLRSAGSAVEMSFDFGQLRRGDARLPVSELHIKHRSGPVAGTAAMAARWIDRHSLWLDVRSIAERGDHLVCGVDAGPPVLARNPVLKRDLHAAAALRVIVGACIDQILPNAAELAAGVGSPEHLHQTRVGLRRLRSALRVFGDWSDAVDSAWCPALAELFARLGNARDRDVITATLLPQLRAAGAPYIELPPDDGKENAGQTLRSPRYGKLLAELVVFARDVAPYRGSSLDADEGSLLALVRPQLNSMHRQLTKDAAVFMSLDDAMRHRTRRRLKRLRYCVEFVASLYGAKAVRRYLARLRPAQDVLGQFNDLTVAEEAFRKQLEKDARAWFAIGCLAAFRMQVLKDAVLALTSLTKAAKFW